MHYVRRIESANHAERQSEQLELAMPGVFQGGKSVPFGKEEYSKMVEANGYEVIVDTKGMRLWADDMAAAKAHIIMASEQVSTVY